ncbi:hypothetical protein MCHI_003905 [Candidatus Magnetoovum chiemensis]|nr:hypothetical protein MCHI_003905 [Candidatus Magnetoovum chiemensis]
MRDGIFDVNELKDSIKAVGFLPMDRIVVSKWQIGDNKKYLVIEGNRRITALKWLIELHESGRETFTEQQLDNFNNLNALLLDDTIAPETAKLILPGLRHVSGIKEWGPYQQAKAVYTLRQSGISAQDTASSLGLSTRKANLLLRSYLALEQMNEDDEYSEYTRQRQYSYFEEALKQPNVRSWLEWNENEKKFTDINRLREFYSWIVGEIDENEEPKDPKLSKATDIRDLARFINDDRAMNRFRSQSGSLVNAMAMFEAEHPQKWQSVVQSAESALASLTPDALRKMSNDDIEIIEKLRGRIKQLFSDYEILTNKSESLVNG